MNPNILPTQNFLSPPTHTKPAVPSSSSPPSHYFSPFFFLSSFSRNTFFFVKKHHNSSITTTTADLLLTAAAHKCCRRLSLLSFFLCWFDSFLPPQVLIKIMFLCFVWVLIMIRSFNLLFWWWIYDYINYVLKEYKFRFDYYI